MTDARDVGAEGESLRRLNVQLLRRAHEAELALAAFAQGEIDGFPPEGSSTPVLLRAAEHALRRSDALFRAVIAKSAEVMSLTTADGQTHYLTPSVGRLLGWAPGERGDQAIGDYVVPEDQPRFAAEPARLSDNGVRDLALEFRARHRDGSIRWIEWTGTNLLDDPDVGAMVNTYRDVTARKQRCTKVAICFRRRRPSRTLEAGHRAWRRARRSPGRSSAIAFSGSPAQHRSRSSPSSPTCIPMIASG